MSLRLTSAPSGPAAGRGSRRSASPAEQAPTKIAAPASATSVFSADSYRSFSSVVPRRAPRSRCHPPDGWIRGIVLSVRGRPGRHGHLLSSGRPEGGRDPFSAGDLREPHGSVFVERAIGRLGDAESRDAIVGRAWDWAPRRGRPRRTPRTRPHRPTRSARGSRSTPVRPAAARPVRPSAAGSAGRARPRRCPPEPKTSARMS